MADHVGGVTSFGRDTPLPITTVLDVCGLDDALWAVQAAGAHRVLRLWSCDCAERVLPLFEGARPDDRRAREAIRVSQLDAHGLTTAAALDAAWAAALAAALAAARAAVWDAALAAARAAARDAVWDAVWDVERAWQAARLRHHLERA